MSFIADGGFDQKHFDDFVLDANVIGFFKEPITLKSGRKSNWYANWRTVTEDVYSTNILTDYIIAFTESKGFNPDCFYGVPEGATKIGILTQNKWALKYQPYGPGSHVLAMGRGNPKDHGMPKDKYFLGMPRGKTIILEDVTTTGGSLIKTADQLIESEIEIIAAFGLTNRDELRDDGKTVEEIMNNKGIPYYALSHAHNLLPRAYEKLKPGKDIAQAVEKEFQEFGIKPLTLA